MNFLDNFSKITRMFITKVLIANLNFIHTFTDLLHLKFLQITSLKLFKFYVHFAWPQPNWPQTTLFSLISSFFGPRCLLNLLIPFFISVLDILLLEGEQKRAITDWRQLPALTVTSVHALISLNKTKDEQKKLLLTL